MKKISTLFNLIHLSSMMVLVVFLLLVSMARDGVSVLFEKKKSTHHVKNKAHTTEKNSTNYIIRT